MTAAQKYWLEQLRVVLECEPTDEDYKLLNTATFPPKRGVRPTTEEA